MILIETYINDTLVFCSMIVSPEQYGDYLGRQLSELEGKVSRRTFQKLQEIERSMELTQESLTLVDYLFFQHQRDGMSFRDMSMKLKMDKKILRSIFDIYGLPACTQAEGVRRELKERWEDPEFRARNAEGVRRNWEDPEFRARNAEGVRRARFDAKNIESYVLPTIYGERTDIGYAQSTWEANISRILLYCHRSFLRAKPLSLEVPEIYRTHFPTGTTDISLDFIVEDPRKNLLAYEIMAHPLENPEGNIKIELLIQQHPELQVRAVTKRIYQRLQHWFAKKIDEDPRFCGWETQKDNLKTNPQKYGADQN